MGPLTAYYQPPLENTLNQVILTEEEFRDTLLTDTFINLPFPAKLTIINAERILCAQGRIATSLRGNPKPIVTMLFESALYPFRTKIEIQSASPITLAFHDDECSYTFTTHKNLHIKRGYIWLDLSINEIKRKILGGHTPILPKLYPKQVLWFRDLEPSFIRDLNVLNDEEKKKKLNEEINLLMPPTHRFMLKFEEEETCITPKMKMNSTDGIMVISERLMKIKIVPISTINPQLS